MHVSLECKTAIVTGAASGIGLATVKQFLDSGASVVAVDIKEEPPADLQQWLQATSDRLAYVQGDVREEATARRYAKTAVDRFGRIDVLVNNAAVSVVKPTHEHTSEDWDLVMDTNVKSAFWAATAVIPVMIQQGGGVILMTGSISGSVGIAGQGAYGPSKGAIHQMARQMAIEYAHFGVRVNAIALGSVDTPILHKSARDSGDAEGFVNGLKAMHPIGRIATAEEAAKFFTYLASDDASFFTGAILALDGGYTAW